MDIKNLLYRVRAPRPASFEDDVATAYANIAHDGHEDGEARDIAVGIATITAHDRLMQFKHDMISRELFESVRRLDTLTRLVRPESEPAMRLVNMHEHMTHDAEHDRVHRALEQKGVSATLGSVDQLGDWSEGGTLDDIFRALPSSRLLRSRGFTFNDTYGDKSASKITYDFRHVNASGRSALAGIRKRAAADVTAEDGVGIEIVKRSSFFIDLARLDKVSARSLKRVLRDGTEDAHQEFGEDVIEPYMHDPSLREGAPIHPAASVYFGLRRFDKPADV